MSFLASFQAGYSKGLEESTPIPTPHTSQRSTWAGLALAPLPLEEVVLLGSRTVLGYHVLWLWSPVRTVSALDLCTVSEIHQTLPPQHWGLELRFSHLRSERLTDLGLPLSGCRLPWIITIPCPVELSHPLSCIQLKFSICDPCSSSTISSLGTQAWPPPWREGLGTWLLFPVGHILVFLTAHALFLALGWQHLHCPSPRLSQDFSSAAAHGWVESVLRQSSFNELAE